MVGLNRRFVTLVFALALVGIPRGVLAQAAPGAAVQSVVPAITVGMREVLPGGTVVSIVVADKISSANAAVGDTFAIRSAADVVVNGWVVIAKGAPGQGEILSVDRAGSHGHPGSLGVQYDWMYLTDGDKVRLTNQRNTEQGKGEAGVSSTMTIISWAFLGLPGLFMHNFVKGHDVEIDSTHPLKAYIDNSVYVVATTRADAGTDYAPTVAAASAPVANAIAPNPLTAASQSGDGSAATANATMASSGMAPLAPPTFAQAVTPTVTAASTRSSAASTEGSVTELAFVAAAPETGAVLNLRGVGPTSSTRFTVSSPWGIAWSYDCRKVTGSTFSVSVEGAGVEPKITPLDPAGASITNYQDPGTYYLKIDSGCAWRVRVYNQTTVGQLPTNR